MERSFLRFQQSTGFQVQLENRFMNFWFEVGEWDAVEMS
jgi:hypothetical protein